MKMIKIAAIGVILAAGAAFAEGTATDSEAMKRESVMKEIGKNMGILGGMAKGEVAYDATAADAAKAAILLNSSIIHSAFEAPGGEDPTSEAKPEIWTSWDDFVKDADALTAAVTAADVSSAEAIGASLGSIGGTCKECHGEYRVKN